MKQWRNLDRSYTYSFSAHYSNLLYPWSNASRDSIPIKNILETSPAPLPLHAILIETPRLVLRYRRSDFIAMIKREKDLDYKKQRIVLGCDQEKGNTWRDRWTSPKLKRRPFFPLWSFKLATPISLCLLGHCCWSCGWVTILLCSYLSNNLAL